MNSCSTILSIDFYQRLWNPVGDRPPDDPSRPNHDVRRAGGGSALDAGGRHVEHAVRLFPGMLVLHGRADCRRLRLGPALAPLQQLLGHRHAAAVHPHDPAARRPPGPAPEDQLVQSRRHPAGPGDRLPHRDDISQARPARERRRKSGSGSRTCSSSRPRNGCAPPLVHQPGPLVGPGRRRLHHPLHHLLVIPVAPRGCAIFLLAAVGGRGIIHAVWNPQRFKELGEGELLMCARMVRAAIVSVLLFLCTLAAADVAPPYVYVTPPPGPTEVDKVYQYSTIGQELACAARSHPMPLRGRPRSRSIRRGKLLRPPK